MDEETMAGLRAAYAGMSVDEIEQAILGSAHAEKVGENARAIAELIATPAE